MSNSVSVITCVNLHKVKIMNSRLSLLILLLLIPGPVTLDRLSVTCIQKSICAVKGSEVTLRCFYSNINFKTVFWFSEKQSTNWRKNNEPEDLTLDSDYSGRVKKIIDKYEAQLTISDVRERDSGEYQLMFIMKDEVKHLSSAVNLTVTELQVRMHPSSTDPRDETVELTCDSSCTLTSGVYYYWMKDGQDFTHTMSRNMLVSISRYAGSFSCYRKDRKYRSSSVCLSQSGCWNVTYTSRRVCALVGSTADISSTYSYPSGHTVNKTFWHYVQPGDIKDLLEEHQFAGRVEYVENKLRIKELKISDSGEYRFRLITNTTNGRYSGSPGVTLTVTDTQVTSSPDTVSGGEKVILSCLTNCTLNDKHIYIWYKNRQQVTDGFTKANKLYLDSVSSEELQQYSCAVGDQMQSTALRNTAVVLCVFLTLALIGVLWYRKRRCTLSKTHRIEKGEEEVQLSNPQLFEYSGIWPTDAFVATKLTSELAAQLQIPIKFEYTNGVVGKVFAPSVVPTTIINLHREILNIFQLNLKKSQNIYEVQEDGVQGTCETQYLISEDEGNNHTTITKSRNLTLCRERIMKDVGLTYIEKCTECQQLHHEANSNWCYDY